MTREQFEEQIEAELKSLRGVIVEIDALLEDADRAEGITPLRASTLAGAFIQQFYNGLETILKQTALFVGLPLPEGTISMRIFWRCSALTRHTTHRSDSTQSSSRT